MTKRKRKQRIPTHKRLALFRAHNKRCQYCDEPLAFSELWVDHIIPEKLSAKPDELEKILLDYELDADFKIHDWGNWLPAHYRCNHKKGTLIFSKNSARYYLEIANDKAERAKEEEKRILRSQLEESIAVIEGLIDQGLITKEEAQKGLDGICYRGLITNHDRLIVTFGINTNELLSSHVLEDRVPKGYLALCDWLEQDLIRKLSSVTSGSFYYTEPSARSGETLSVRLGFIGLKLEALDRLDSDWWEILDISFESETDEYWFGSVT